MKKQYQVEEHGMQEDFNKNILVLVTSKNRDHGLGHVLLDILKLEIWKYHEKLGGSWLATDHKLIKKFRDFFFLNFFVNLYVIPFKTFIKCLLFKKLHCSFEKAY